jgi:hypothetical protein
VCSNKPTYHLRCQKATSTTTDKCIPETRSSSTKPNRQQKQPIPRAPSDCTHMPASCLHHACIMSCHAVIMFIMPVSCQHHVMSCRYYADIMPSSCSLCLQIDTNWVQTPYDNKVAMCKVWTRTPMTRVCISLLLKTECIYDPGAITAHPTTSSHRLPPVRTRRKN